MPSAAVRTAGASLSRCVPECVTMLTAPDNLPAWMIGLATEIAPSVISSYE